MLTNGHIAHIQSSIEHLLDFSLIPTELDCQLHDLQTALIEEVPKENDFSQLRKILMHPQETLMGLEKYTKKAEAAEAPTLGEVQQTVIKLTCEALKAVVQDEEKFAILSTSLHQKANALINNKTFNKKFISSKPPTPSTLHLPWEMIHTEGQIFTVSLMLQDDSLEINLKINMTINNVLYFFELADFDSLPEDVDDYEDYEMHFCPLIPLAMSNAMQISANTALDILHGNNLVSAEKYDLAIDNKNLSPLLSHEYFLDLLFKKEASLEDFLKLSTEGISICTHPSTVYLLKLKLLSLTEAMQLSEAQLKVIQCYSHFLTQNKLTVSQILSLSNAKAQFLITPVIANLLKQNSITFSQLLKIEKPVRKLFLSSLYSDFFLRITRDQNWDWEIISQFNKKHVNFLLKPYISALIKNDVLTFNEVSQLENEQLSIIKRTNINTLLLHKHLTLREINAFSLDILYFIDKDNFVTNCILQNFITVKEIKSTDPLDVYSYIFCKRLTNTFEYNLSQTGNAKDHPSIICDEIREVSELNKLPTLIEVTCEKLLNKIEEDIINYTFKLNENDASLLKQLSELINSLKENQELAWQQRIAKLSIYADEQLNSNIFRKRKCCYSNNLPFFGNLNTFYAETYHPISASKKIYQGIASLSTFSNRLPRIYDNTNDQTSAFPCNNFFF